jgi:gas vesicle protein
MKSGKIITGLVIGTVVALIIIPKTRKMLSDAVDSITGAIRDMADKAKDAADKSRNELNKYADKAKDIASAAKATKEAMQ